MAHDFYIGIDNGTSGAIGVVSNTENFTPILIQTPSFMEQSYTKKKANISRVNVIELENFLKEYSTNSFILIERPLVNPTRFKATLSAMRALEATLITIEKLGIPFQYTDSKQWQKEMLPSGFKGKELKDVSSDIACRLFPHLKDIIKKQKDGDAILMAEYARRKNL